MVKTSADALLVVINDILDFSKIEAGKFHLDRSIFNLSDSLEETTRTLGVMAGEKGLELLCDIQSDVPQMVVGDPTRLRQIIVNLIGNAIKFTERGEVVLQIEAKRKPDHLVSLHFSVRDTGIGIAEDKLAHIFEAFAQADSSTSRKYGGTGLGLTISSRFVEMMGGKIWVERNLGHGSTFHFTADFELPQETLLPKQESEQDVNLAGLPVLIVDDNPTNLRILEKTVLQWGMKPILANSGPAASGVTLIRPYGVTSKSGQWELQDLALKIGCGKDGSCAALEIALRFPPSHNLCDGFDLADIPEHPKDWHWVGQMKE